MKTAVLVAAPIEKIRHPATKALKVAAMAQMNLQGPLGSPRWLGPTREMSLLAAQRPHPPSKPTSPQRLLQPLHPVREAIAAVTLTLANHPARGAATAVIAETNQRPALKPTKQHPGSRATTMLR